MSEATPAPAAPVAPPAAPIAPPAPPPTAPAVDTEPPEGNEPAWAKTRLTRAEQKGRASLLRDLGVEDPEVLKQALADRNARIEAEKTAAQKAADEKARADKLAAERDELHAAVVVQATSELARLTEAQRAAVVDLAGDNPAKQITTIAKLRPTWAAAPPPSNTAPPATAQTEPPKPAPLPPPANTAPAGNAPPPRAPESTDHLAVFESIKNPITQAAYYERNKNAIEAARKARKPA